MSTLQNDLRDYIETQLNDNTQGVVFDLYTYREILNDNVSRERQIENSYRLEEKRYISCVLEDFIGDIVPIQGTNAIEYEIPLTLRVQVDEDSDRNSGDQSFDEVYFDKFLLAMEEFKDKFVGTSADINGYTYVFNVSTMTPASDIQTDEGVDYILFTLEIYANGSDKLYFGNQVTYSIDGNTVTPIERLDGYTASATTEQLLNDVKSLNINRDNVWETSLSFYYDGSDIHKKMLNQILSNKTPQNTVYTLDVAYPDLDAYSKDCIIVEGGVTPPIGDYIVFTITFREYIE